MKFNGQINAALTPVPFILPKGGQDAWTFLLHPLPLGFHRRLRDRGILPPTPPVKVARDSSGKPLRDPQGMATTYFDAHHPDYLKQLDQYHLAVAVLTLKEGLRADPQVTFDSLSPENDAGPVAWMEHTMDLFHELEQAGFTAGDLLKLCQEICRLSNLIDPALNAAQRSFSAAGQNGPA